MAKRKTFHYWTLAEKRAFLEAADEVAAEMESAGIAKLRQEDLAKAAGKRAGLEGVVTTKGLAAMLGSLLRDRREAEESASPAPAPAPAPEDYDNDRDAALSRLLAETTATNDRLARVEDKLDALLRAVRSLDNPRQLKLVEDASPKA